MKYYLLPAMLLIVSASAFQTMAEEEHHHHDVSEQKIALNEGEKWPIDESLHIGMSAIKGHITSNLKDIHYDRFSDAQYNQLAVELDEQLAYLFKNCQLPPKADAQLHILLAKVMQGVNAIKQTADKKQGVILVIQALKTYPRYFNDPAWLSLQH